MKAVIRAIRKDGKGFMGADEVWYALPQGDKLPGNIEKGMEVEFDYKVNGDWNNIQGSVTPTDSTINNTSATPAARGGGKFFPVPTDTKDHIIMRQNALTAASNVYRGHGPDMDMSKVLEAAEQFVTWTTGRQ